MKKKEIKCNNITRRDKMLQKKTQKNIFAKISWPSIQILIIGGSGFGKTNSLLNLINEEPDVDNIYLYVKDLY